MRGLSYRASEGPLNYGNKFHRAILTLGNQAGIITWRESLYLKITEGLLREARGAKNCKHIVTDYSRRIPVPIVTFALAPICHGYIVNGLHFVHIVPWTREPRQNKPACYYSPSWVKRGARTPWFVLELSDQPTPSPGTRDLHIYCVHSLGNPPLNPVALLTHRGVKRSRSWKSDF